jgi:predicted O-methyltransferase YrrM
MLKPSTVVETGVGAGISSSFILQALHDNDFGKLYSIDLPRAVYQSSGQIVNDTSLIPKGMDSGWTIPNNLKNKWTLLKGRSKDRLPELVNKLQSIDLFFHDSEHTYENMLFEYETVWPHIRSKGILASHDVCWNDAFLDFSKKIMHVPSIKNNNYGWIIKK